MENKSLSDSFESIGKDFQSSIPHIIIPTKEDKKKEVSAEEISEPPTPKKNLFNDKETRWVDNTQKWFLILVTALIIGYGIYRIFKGVIW